jgi:hypothetical protein
MRGVDVQLRLTNESFLTDSSITGVQLAKKLKNHHYRYLNKFGPSHP